VVEEADATGEGGLRDECAEHAYCRGIWGHAPPRKIEIYASGRFFRTCSIF